MYPVEGSGADRYVDKLGAKEMKKSMVLEGVYDIMKMCKHANESGYEPENTPSWLSDRRQSTSRYKMLTRA